MKTKFKRVELVNLRSYSGERCYGCSRSIGTEYYLAYGTGPYCRKSCAEEGASEAEVDDRDESHWDCSMNG